MRPVSEPEINSQQKGFKPDHHIICKCPHKLQEELNGLRGRRDACLGQFIKELKDAEEIDIRQMNEY